MSVSEYKSALDHSKLKRISNISFYVRFLIFNHPALLWHTNMHHMRARLSIKADFFLHLVQEKDSAQCAAAVLPNQPREQAEEKDLISWPEEWNLCEEVHEKCWPFLCLDLDPMHIFKII